MAGPADAAGEPGAGLDVTPAAADEAAGSERRESRDLAERLVLALFGALALTADRAEQAASNLSETGAVRRDELRSSVDDLVSRWRGDAVRVSEKTRVGLSGLFRELGLVSRDDLDELELRVAQLEHRLRLLEDDTSA